MHAFPFKLQRTCALKEISQEDGEWRYMTRAKSRLEPTKLYSMGTLKVKVYCSETFAVKHVEVYKTERGVALPAQSPLNFILWGHLN